jgi:hypothetical protein
VEGGRCPVDAHKPRGAFLGELTIVSLSGPFWTLAGNEVKPDGTFGDTWPIYWFDPPTGPP